MKKITLIAIALFFTTTAIYAKKIKFAVDMSNETISPFGVHLSGDFQVIAGYSSDWCSDCTPLTQEGSSSVYSIVLDLPAFNKYEYKFLNGDQFYEAEFVPIESRVGHNFNDNRWFYLDSISTDTAYVGAIVFAANAPVGLNLVRFLVDMQNQTVSGNGVHLAGDFQTWNASKNTMYHFDDAPNGLYEVIQYFSPSTIHYKFYNGNTLTDSETVPTSCATSGNRELTISADVILSEVCFSSCNACSVNGINEQLSNNNNLFLYPNPTSNFTTIEFVDMKNKSIVITDMNGKVVTSLASISSASLKLETDGLSKGAYFVNVKYENNSTSKAKLIIQ